MTADVWNNQAQEPGNPKDPKAPGAKEPEKAPVSPHPDTRNPAETDPNRVNPSQGNTPVDSFGGKPGTGGEDDEDEEAEDLDLEEVDTTYGDDEDEDIENKANPKETILSGVH